jgi:RHS repeat-associated protein
LVATRNIINNGAPAVFPVATDHLGSIVAEHNPHKNYQLEFFGYDAWGRRYRFDSPNIGPPNFLWFDQRWLAPNNLVGTLEFFTRGYTGHEHLDFFGLINMNGRMYDPMLGRMLSPDPFVQAPTFSQSFNRYSYVWNNPLKFTDPSGYMLEDAWYGWGGGGTGGSEINMSNFWTRAGHDYSWRGFGTGGDFWGPAVLGLRTTDGAMGGIDDSWSTDNPDDIRDFLAWLSGNPTATVNAIINRIEAIFNGTWHNEVTPYGWGVPRAGSTSQMIRGVSVRPVWVSSWKQASSRNAGMWQGARDFWNDNRNRIGNMIDGAYVFGELANAPGWLRGGATWSGRAISVPQAVRDGISLYHGNLHGIDRWDATFNAISMMGWQGAVISLGYEGAKWGAMQIQEFERRLRLNFHWSSSFWYYP